MSDPPKVTYQYSRLTFHRDSIETLEPNDRFRIETPVGAFEMSRTDFYETFPGVVRSKSYKKGLYSCKSVPRKAQRYLVDKQPWTFANPSGGSEYELPSALVGRCDPKAYKKWLHRKAVAHVVRDRKRWPTISDSITVSNYKKAIHAAVLKKGTHDAYTNEVLRWELISTYDNAESKNGGSIYKKKLALLPTVDHAGEAPGDRNFRICAWRTNDAKSDLTLLEFVELCRKVIAVHEVSVK